MNKNFWKNKKVFITGHTGFKGGWLTQILLVCGADICGYSLEPNTNPNLFEALSFKKNIRHYIGDIRNFDALNKAIKDFQPDIVFHLAAQALVRDSYDDPRYTYDVNVMGTVNVLEAMRLNNIKAGVIITTDKVYKNLETNRAFREDDPLGGYDPYSNSKSCADLVVDSYVKSFFNLNLFQKEHNTLVASTRSGNVIGGGDWSKDRLIPDFIRSVFEDNEAMIVRSPESTRPWQHVLEPLFGYLKLGEELLLKNIDKVGAWNFGPKNEQTATVSRVLDLCKSTLGKGEYKIQADNTKHEAKFLQLDIGKAQKNLKWMPVFNVEEAIEKTLGWYKVFYEDSSNIEQYTINQISNKN